MPGEVYKEDSADADTKKAEVALVDKCVAELRKHFQGVQIFVTRETTPEDLSIGREQFDTISIIRGSGNFFTRYGIVQLWVKRNDEIERSAARRDAFIE